MMESPKTATFDMEAAVQNLHRRREARRGERARLHEAAVRDAAAIIDMIRSEFNPTRMYQWGSVLDPDRFDENSDIDIAVEGIGSPGEFFALMGKAMDMTHFALDIVEFDKLDDLSRTSILVRGKVVYERPQ